MKNTHNVSVFDINRQKSLGAYYTPDDAAEYMASWALRQSSDTLLEPSFGDGNFIRAIRRVAQKRLIDAPRIVGYEISPLPLEHAIGSGLLGKVDARQADFLSSSASGSYDAVIANPPYVRLRHVNSAQRVSALARAASSITEGMDPSGSLWMPFVLHATHFLRRGGRMAFVLPYDSTYVKYARPMWRFLGRHFGDIRVVRVRDRIFSDVLQDVILLFADDAGATSDELTFDAYDSVVSLVEGLPSSSEKIALKDIAAGSRPFIEGLLDPELRALLDLKVNPSTVALSEVVKFGIGYVAGDKKFFHPDVETVEEYQLPLEHLLPALTSSRSLRGGGAFTSNVSLSDRKPLYLPAGQLSAGEKRYIHHGVATGVSERFKCRIREPWYAVPGVRVPDYLLSVFSSRPVLLQNDAGLVASNSLLCGFDRGVLRPGELLARWYNSLTLLQCELQVHSLGGGVLVLIPGEVAHIRVNTSGHASSDSLKKIDAVLRSGDLATAYRFGDDFLRSSLSLSDHEMRLIVTGAETLTRWRTRSNDDSPDGLGGDRETEVAI